jgi:hypothetical protein
MLILKWLCCKDYVEAHDIVDELSLCSSLEEQSGKRRLQKPSWFLAPLIVEA